MSDSAPLQVHAESAAVVEWITDRPRVALPALILSSASSPQQVQADERC